MSELHFRVAALVNIRCFCVRVQLGPRKVENTCMFVMLDVAYDSKCRLKLSVGWYAGVEHSCVYSRTPGLIMEIPTCMSYYVHSIHIVSYVSCRWMKNTCHRLIEYPSKNCCPFVTPQPFWAKEYCRHLRLFIHLSVHQSVCLPSYC